MATLDIRLIAVDMDGTLLDPQGRVPDRLWPLLARLRERGILFAPASGRQYATLHRTFADHAEGMAFIAENGAFVVRDGLELHLDRLESGFVLAALQALRALSARHDVGAVVCGARTAWVQRRDPEFLDEAGRYYASLQFVPDLRAVAAQAIKIAVCTAAGESAEVAAALADGAGLAAGHQVVVSGARWVDLMNAGVNKGVALARLQRLLGIDRAQTAAFGDYLNDLELLDAAHHSYAMANAHPEVLARARLRAPSNAQHGVITEIERMLGA